MSVLLRGRFFRKERLFKGSAIKIGNFISFGHPIVHSLNVARKVKRANAFFKFLIPWPGKMFSSNSKTISLFGKHFHSERYFIPIFSQRLDFINPPVIYIFMKEKKYVIYSFKIKIVTGVF